MEERLSGGCQWPGMKSAAARFAGAKAGPSLTASTGSGGNGEEQRRGNSKQRSNSLSSESVETASGEGQRLRTG